MGNAVITFDLRAGTIVVEGPTEDLAQLFDAVRAVAPTLREIRIVTSDRDATAPRRVDPAQVRSVPDGKSQHVAPGGMVAFAARTTPTNMAERIAVLAYYATHELGTTYFTIDDMSIWFQQCGFPMPSEMRVAMADAGRKQYRYVQNESRNRWRLTARGETEARRIIDRGRGPGPVTGS